MQCIKTVGFGLRKKKIVLLMESWRALMTSVHYRLKYKYKMHRIGLLFNLCYFRHNIIYLVITKCKHALIKQLITKGVSCATRHLMTVNSTVPSQRQMCTEIMLGGENEGQEPLQFCGGLSQTIHQMMWICFIFKTEQKGTLFRLRTQTGRALSGLERKPKGHSDIQANTHQTAHVV